jgi:putative solute:sodium symporter small subunit
LTCRCRRLELQPCHPPPAHRSFLFSCVFSIFLVDRLNEFKLGGFPLGFWIAQQGTIYVFVVEVLAYVLIMRKLDRKYDVEEDDA